MANTLDTVEQSDRANLIGAGVVWTGNLAVQEIADSASVHGQVWFGFVQTSEQSDTASFAGTPLSGLRATEKPDSANFIGAISLSAGSLVAKEIGDTAQFISPAPVLPIVGSYVFKPNEDRHVRRSGDDYGQAFMQLLPRGQAWPRSPSSILVMTCEGLCGYWGFVDSRAADLLERESDPRHTVELLPDWERNWGLPDPCFTSPTTIAERQLMLVTMMTWLGGQSRQYFIDLMARLGFQIAIKENAPFMCGISEVGDTRYEYDNSGAYRWYIGPPEMRFVWSADVGQIGLKWFRCASGQTGVDHHLEFSVPNDATCILNRWKPAHTDLVYDFSSLAAGGPMQGTP